MSLNILALDPGGTTGWASYRNGEFEHGQIGPDEHHLLLWALLKGRSWSHVVCERFEYRNTSRAGLEIISREYIGVVKLWCQLYKCPLTLQNASQAKGFVKDKNLKRMSLFHTGDDHKHAMDAYRHLLFYIINTSAVGREIKTDILNLAWTS